MSVSWMFWCSLSILAIGLFYYLEGNRVEISLYQVISYSVGICIVGILIFSELNCILYWSLLLPGLASVTRRYIEFDVSFCASCHANGTPNFLEYDPEGSLRLYVVKQVCLDRRRSRLLVLLHVGMVCPGCPTGGSIVSIAIV